MTERWGKCPTCKGRGYITRKEMASDGVERFYKVECMCDSGSDGSGSAYLKQQEDLERASEDCWNVNSGRWEDFR